MFVLFFAIIHSVRGYNSGEIWQDLPKPQGQNELYEQPKNYRQKYWKWPKVIDKTSVLVVDGGENSTIEQKNNTVGAAVIVYPSVSSFFPSVGDHIIMIVFFMKGTKHSERDFLRTR